jgi:hypothetical protein
VDGRWTLVQTETKGSTMSTTRFKTTLDAIKGGVKSFTVDKATTNIEGWEDYLSKHDHEGVKKVVADLAKLKKLLHAKELDGEAIKKLVSKLGKDTVAVAGEEHNSNANHIRELGEALSQAAESGEASTGKENDEEAPHKKTAAKKAE